MNTLGIFYSFEGNTKKVMQIVASELKCDLLEIKPVKEVSTHGFMKFFWGGKQAFMKNTPELQPFDTKIEDYDHIVIGTPVWAGTMAPPIRTLIETGRLANKKITVVYTHDGGANKFRERIELELKKYNCTILNYIELVNVSKGLDKDTVLKQLV